MKVKFKHLGDTETGEILLVGLASVSVRLDEPFTSKGKQYETVTVNTADLYMTPALQDHLRQERKNLRQRFKNEPMAA